MSWQITTEVLNDNILNYNSFVADKFLYRKPCFEKKNLLTDYKYFI